MISTKKITAIADIQKLQYLATKCESNVGIHSMDDSIMVDAKSYIGLFALDFNEPVRIVCEDENFHKLIKDLGENV